MKMVMVATLALLSSAGGTSAQQGDLTPAQRALARCYGRNIADLDDRISDARSIARAVVIACEEERREYVASILTPRDRTTPEAVARGMFEHSVDSVLMLILKVRAEQRRKAP